MSKGNIKFTIASYKKFGYAQLVHTRFSIMTYARIAFYNITIYNIGSLSNIGMLSPNIIIPHFSTF